MAITYRQYGTSEQYMNSIIELISRAEGHAPTVQDTGDDQATIGYGYTFDRNNNVALWTAAGIYSTLDPQQQQLLQRIDDAPANEKTSIARTFTGAITPDEGRNLVRVTIPEYEGPANALNMPLSRERVAFVALTYNRGPGNLSERMYGFYQAIRDSDRAEAWFQIRYRSLGSSDYPQAIAKARYLESQVFGLYDDPNNVSAQEAYSVFKMLQRRRTEVAQYESQFGVRFDETPGARNMINEGNSDANYQQALTYFGLNRIDTIHQALDYGKTALIADLRRQYENNPDLRARLTDNNFRSVDIYVNPAKETAPPTHRSCVIYASPSATPRNSLMIGMDQRDHLSGRNGNDVLIGGAGDDVLWGEDGVDVLIGGAGVDHLIGGKGDDVLYGGADNDTCFIYTGDGTDRIEDKEGSKNRVVVNGRVVGDFCRQSDGSLQTGDRRFRGEYQRTDFVVTEIATGTKVILNENFQEGDFGIRFYDELTPPDNPVTTNVIRGDQNPEKPNDTLTDTSGNDLILGGAGDDYVYSDSGGQDWIKGGDGCDLLDGLESTDSIIEGGDGSDVLLGSRGTSNQLFGDSYGDMQTLIDAGETAESTNQKGDLICGGYPGDDNFLYGSNGNDLLLAFGGKDLIVGAAGDDLILSDFWQGIGVTPEIVHDWSFTIQVDQDKYTPVISGIYLFGSVDDEGDYDVIYAGAGNDFVDSGGGDDEVHAGTGNDIVCGQAGADFIEGGDGDDVLMLDMNGNGRLDSGRELFGGMTILPNGVTAVNGFQALAFYDANGDGRIDANDPVWSQLRVWQHLDYDSYYESESLNTNTPTGYKYFVSQDASGCG